jgi:hypothetical protein
MSDESEILGAEDGSGSRRTDDPNVKGANEPLEAGVAHGAPGEAKPAPWSQFVKGASDSDVKQRFLSEAEEILGRHGKVREEYAIVVLLDSEGSIGTFDLDQVYSALRSANADRKRNVLLILLSKGGSIESAYQISKICKAYASRSFVVAVPREAKSAATLIALGADQIHMGPLGQLGPIDPQLKGLPALGVSKALESIARLAERFPGSSEMFARYLRLAVTVEQIGYSERISESAVQYAERLLRTKAQLGATAPAIARELVHEYKDHGFVIDLEEAQLHLGDSWVVSKTKELALAEELYDLFDLANLFLSVYRKKRLAVIGGYGDDAFIFEK